MQTIQSLLEDASHRHAGRIAVVAGELRWTYADFASEVRGLAARLLEEGVAPGDRVAVLDDNTPSFLAAYFAAPWIGAVLQPLNHRLAPRELQAALEDAETRVLLAGAGRVESARALRGVRVLAGDVEPAEEPAVPFRSAPDDLAQLYYTSGTTGRPKGVMLTQRNVCAHAACAVRELGLAPTDRWGHFAPMFHLADAWATFALTAVGGVHVMEPRFTAEGALDAIERERVTLTNLVPTMLTRMVAHPRAATFDPSSLRLVLSGGAPITPAPVRRIVETFRCEYVQTYGMTETSPYLTLGILHEHLRALPREERLRYAARTGRPFAAVELEVVDDAGAPVPGDDRTVGEIRVRGETVSPGYWRRPEETARAHREGWLYTGDLAVVDGEGYVDIVDRRSDMILTGGENVYSTEVENALTDHPDVLAAAAFGLPDETLGEIVCAAVVLAPSSRATTAELSAWCRERIAAYKTPRCIELVAELPTTGTGKVSKRLLREAAVRGELSSPGFRGVPG